MKTSEQIKLNKFIASVSLFYDDDKKEFKDAYFKKINNVNAYIAGCFQKIYKRMPKPEELAYIQRFLKTPYDFENVAYKTYLKELVKLQSPKIINDLKSNYDFYLESIQDKAGSKQCIYISGESGYGKTTIAKALAEQYFPEDEIFVGAGGNHPFDAYYGQKCIIVDDFRDSDMRYSDLLKLLDNNTTSDVGARYHNRSLARCKLIILTSTVSPLNLYRGIDEERYQLYRRIKYFKITRNESNVTLNYMECDKFNYYHKAEVDFTKQFNEYREAHPQEDVIDITKMFNLDKPQEPVIDDLVPILNDEDLPF